MSKRILSSVLALLVILTMTGCSSILEGEVTEITPYTKADDTAGDDSAIEVSTYDQFRQEVYNMVQTHTETAAFRITTFDRDDLEGSLNEICRELSSVDPLGSYATYYISCQITPIVGYHDVAVTIVFKKDYSEISNISTVSTDRYLQVLLDSALTDFSSTCTFYTSLSSVTADYIKEIIHNQYYSSPLDMIIIPEITVTSYPETDGNRIMEVSFAYNYNHNVLSDMNNNLNEEIQKIISELPDADDHELLLSVYNTMAASCVYLPNPSTKLASTAYSVIVNSTGDDEGAAMAFKALCDKLLIDCIVVNGKYMGEDHFWNIVTFDGISYHVDITTQMTDGTETFLKGDEFMRENYWWDTSAVPQCTSDYILEDEPPVTEETTVTEEVQP